MEGITIRGLNIDDFAVVREYMLDDFIPDEPVMGSMELMEGDGFFDKIIHKEVEKAMLLRSIEGGASFAAFDDKGQIAGVRLGQIFTPETLPPFKGTLWMLNLPEFLVPTRFEKMAYLEKLFNAIGYSYANAFKQCENHNGKIYVGFALGVAKAHRGKGLGKILSQESVKHAKDQGCSHQYLMASGIYSQSIFEKQGFTTMKVLPYDQVLDRHGRQIVNHPVHKSMKLMNLVIK